MWLIEYTDGGRDEATSLDAFFKAQAASITDWTSDNKLGRIKWAAWESDYGQLCTVSPKGIEQINHKLDEIEADEELGRTDEGAYRDSMGVWKW